MLSSKNSIIKQIYSVIEIGENRKSETVIIV